MKKIIMVVTIFISAFMLTACEHYFPYDGYEGGYYGGGHGDGYNNGHGGDHGSGEQDD